MSNFYYTICYLMQHLIELVSFFFSKCFLMLSSGWSTRYVSFSKIKKRKNENRSFYCNMRTKAPFSYWIRFVSFHIKFWFSTPSHSLFLLRSTITIITGKRTYCIAFHVQTTISYFEMKSIVITAKNNNNNNKLLSIHSYPFDLSHSFSICRRCCIWID